MKLIQPRRAGGRSMLTAGVAVAALLLIPGGNAFAQGSDDTMAKVTCTFEGLAGIANPGVESIGNDLNGLDPFSLQDVDDGSFEFSGPASCTGQDVGGEEKLTLLPGLNNVQIEASGHYDNMVCGTGTVRGQAVLNLRPGATVIVNSPPGLPSGPTPATGQIQAQFGIAFVAGNGKITGAIDNGSITPTGRATNVIHSGESLGAVNIVPDNGDCVSPGPGGNVQSFRVTGALTASLGGKG